MRGVLGKFPFKFRRRQSMKRALCFLFIFIMVLGCFGGCVDNVQNGGETTEALSDVILPETGDGESESESESVPPAEETEAPIPEEFRLSEKVSVIYTNENNNSIEKKAAERVAEAIGELFGVSVTVKSDWGYAEGGEIVVGKCKYRESSIAFADQLYAEGYGFSVLSANEIVVSANDSQNILSAVDLFVDELLKKSREPIFYSGTTCFCNNERPFEEYFVNGAALSSYVIVSDEESSAKYLYEAIKDNLYTKLPIVSEKDFAGGHSFRIGSYGCEDYNGDRFAVSSDMTDGVSTVYIDGETRALRLKGIDFLIEKYLGDGANTAEKSVPDRVYAHLGGNEIYEVSSEVQELAEGVTYYRKHYNNFDDKNIDVYITAVAGNSPATFGVWVADFDSHSGKAKLDVKTVGVIAHEFEKSGVNVIAATNAGYFHKSAGTNYPWGMQIVNGEVVWEPSHEDDRYSNNWVGITFDGKMVGGNVEDYQNIYKGKIKYGVGCGSNIMKDGVATVKPTTKSVVCYTAIAFTADGGFVLLCVDGRPHLRNGKSEGASGFDLVSIFRDLDLEYTEAYILDGGGSTEMVTERVEGSSAFITRNDPSDGSSRPVSDIIAVFIP